MVIFNKKAKKKSSPQEDNSEDIPQLPELPKLPEVHDDNDYSNESYNRQESNQLPSFPQNNLGNQLSQDTIKEAVSGEKEEDSWADDFGQYDEDDQMMPQESLYEPPEPSNTTDSYSQLYETPKKEDKNEPLFVRIDKFEEGLKTFEKLKEKTMDIEKLLKNIKKEKEEETKEIDNWEKELESMKSKIESLNNSIFSKIE